MKVLCISKWVKTLTPDAKQSIMPKEVPATLQLYLNGVIEQFWVKQDAPGVVFLVSAESVDAAKSKVGALPLVEAGFLDFEYIAVGPLAPLGMLIRGK